MTNVKSRMNEIISNAYALSHHAAFDAINASSDEEIAISLHELKLAMRALKLCKNFRDLIFEDEDQIDGLSKIEVERSIRSIGSMQEFAVWGLMKKIKITEENIK